MTALAGLQDDRIRQLEADVAELRNQIRQLTDVPPNSTSGDQWALVRTKAGATSYPMNGDTFPAVRLVGRFAKTQGMTAAEFVEIDDKDERIHIKSPNESYIPAGEQLLAMFKEGNWWVIRSGSGSAMIFGQVVNAAAYGAVDIEMTREDGGSNITDIRWDRFGCDGDHLEIDDWIGIVEATDGMETWWRIVRHHTFSVLEIRDDATVGDENIFLDRDDNACYTVESGDCS